MTKSRMVLVSLLVFALVAAVTPVVYALASGPADADAGVYSNDAGLTQNDGHVRAEAGDAACAQARWSYLKWDLSDVPPGTVLGYANLSLFTNLINNATAGAQLTLYQVLDDSWTETTVTSANDPGLGTIIQSVPIPPVNSTVTFNSPALLSYVQQQADGDNVVSFGLGLTGNCGAATVLVRMYSKDSAVADTQKPYLTVSTSPTSVDLTESSAERISWPLYAGLGAAALFVVAGVVISRRRTA